MLLYFRFFNRLVGRGKTIKKLRKFLNELYLGMSLSTKNPINFFKNIPLIELDEWFEVIDNYYKVINKK